MSFWTRSSWRFVRSWRDNGDSSGIPEGECASPSCGDAAGALGLFYVDSIVEFLLAFGLVTAWRDVQGSGRGGIVTALGSKSLHLADPRGHYAAYRLCGSPRRKGRN